MQPRELPGDLGYFIPGTRISASGDMDVRLSSAVYVLVSDGESCLVDAGNGAASFERLSRCLAHSALSPDRVIVTHHHYDHVSNGSLLKAEHGAFLLMHGASQRLIERVPGPCHNNLKGWKDGAANLQTRTCDPGCPDASTRGRATADGTLVDGDVVTVGNLDLQILHTPGHTPGSISVFIPTHGALFAGDLPMWMGPGQPHPLGNYAKWVGSMRRILELDVKMIGWGHAVPTVGRKSSRRFLENTLNRVENLKSHVLRCLDSGPATIGEIADGLEPGATHRELLENSLHSILWALAMEGTATSTGQIPRWQITR